MCSKANLTLYLILQLKEINMYINYTKAKTLLTSAAVSISLVLSSVALAGPGKPGKGNANPAIDDLNIVEIAVAVNDNGNGEFNNLLAAVGCFTDPVDMSNPIIDLLSGTDKYTLFAPVDAAFDDLLCRLDVTSPCDLDLATLEAVLTYHVVDGRRFSNSVFNKNNAKVIETLAAVDLVSVIDKSGEAPVPTLHDVDGQSISPVEGLFNINATNGVIHVIDGVLLPIEGPAVPEACIAE